MWPDLYIQNPLFRTLGAGIFWDTRTSMELSSYLVSWVVTYLGDLQPTYIGVIIYLLSSMDIPVGSTNDRPQVAAVHS